MEDNDYLRLLGLMKYLVNPDYESNQNSNGPDFNFTEGTLVMKKF
jgi:hypothetical protein